MTTIARFRLFAAVALAAATVAATTASAAASASSGPPYPCAATGGPNADASAIGWLGNAQGATACLGGSFYVPNGINTTYGFGVYNYARTSWTNADGYLPALVTSFASGGAQVSITNFGDRVVLGGHPYVLIYSRVAVHNPTSQSVTVDPQPTPGLVPLNAASSQVAPGATADHDYVVAEDRFGGTYAWPSTAQLQSAGGYDAHFAHMRAFWDGQLSQTAQLTLPDSQLADAWKAGFIYTQIDRSGNALDTGTNGYHQEYEHDVVGILGYLFDEGYFTGAHALLDETDRVVGTNTQYADGTWVYPWLWAVYVEKTGDTKFLAARFSSPGPLGAKAEPSIETAAHDIAAARTGPGGIIGKTDDIDANGYWTSDNYEALLGLAGYEYLAKAVGDKSRGELGGRAVQQPAEGGELHAVGHDLSGQPRLHPLLDGGAEHRQPVHQPGGRQLGRPRRLLQLGVERLPARGHGDPAGRGNHGRLDRQDPVLRVRPGHRHAAARHLRRLPGRGLLLDRVQRRLRRLGPRQQQLPGPGDPLLRVPDRPRPERAVRLVGGLDLTQHDDAVDRRPPVRRRRLLAALLGYRHGRPRPARLAGRPARRRNAHRRPRRPRQLADLRAPDRGHQLPGR